MYFTKIKLRYLSLINDYAINLAKCKGKKSKKNLDPKSGPI